MEEVDKNFATDKSSLFIRFLEELIVGETLPGQDSSVELEMMVDSENKLDVNCLNDMGIQHWAQRLLLAVSNVAKFLFSWEQM